MHSERAWQGWRIIPSQSAQPFCFESCQEPDCFFLCKFSNENFVQTGHSRAVNEPFPELTKNLPSECALRSEIWAWYCYISSVQNGRVQGNGEKTSLNLCGLTTFFLLLHKSILVSTCSANEDYLDKQMPSFRSILVYSFELSLQNHPNLKFPIGALL